VKLIGTVKNAMSRGLLQAGKAHFGTAPKWQPANPEANLFNIGIFKKPL